MCTLACAQVGPPPWWAHPLPPLGAAPSLWQRAESLCRCGPWVCFGAPVWKSTWGRWRPSSLLSVTSTWRSRRIFAAWTLLPEEAPPVSAAGFDSCPGWTSAAPPFVFWWRWRVDRWGKRCCLWGFRPCWCWAAFWPDSRGRTHAGSSGSGRGPPDFRSTRGTRRPPPSCLHCKNPWKRQDLRSHYLGFTSAHWQKISTGRSQNIYCKQVCLILFLFVFNFWSYLSYTMWAMQSVEPLIQPSKPASISLNNCYDPVMPLGKYWSFILCFYLGHYFH